MSTPEENALTIRAAAEVFVPGSPHDPTPGAADVHAELFISHYLDFLIPGLATGLPDLLNELSATTFDGRTFVDLSLDERLTILDQNDAIKKRFLTERNWADFYGLPVGYAETDQASVLRTQRSVWPSGSWAKVSSAEWMNWPAARVAAGSLPSLLPNPARSGTHPRSVAKRGLSQ